MQIKNKLFKTAAEVLNVKPVQLFKDVGLYYSAAKLDGRIIGKQVQEQALDKLDKHLRTRGYKIAIVPVNSVYDPIFEPNKIGIEDAS